MTSDRNARILPRSCGSTAAVVLTYRFCQPGSQAVLAPAPLDQRRRRVVQHALLGPPALAAVALGRQLAGGVHPELAAEELLVGGMVEVVDRPDGVLHVVGVVDVAERAPG